MADLPSSASPTPSPPEPVDPTGPDLSRTRAALALTIGVLVAYNVGRSIFVPSGPDIVTNLVVAALLAGVAWWGGQSLAEIGLAATTTRRGLLFGGAAILAVAAVVGLAAAVSAGSSTPAFDDDRTRVGAASMAFTVLVAIPLGTVVLEELAFRGTLLAFLQRLLPVRSAVLAGSVLFGFWHVAPAIQSAGDNAALSGIADSPLGLAATVAGTVLATTVAGLVFCWLRLRSRSLLAPALAHVGTNSVPFFIAWLVNR